MKHAVKLFALCVICCWCMRSALAYDPYYVECYLDAGPHAYEQDSCYTYRAKGPTATYAYFMPSNAFLALLGSSISPPFVWSAPECASTPAFSPCVVLVRNHTDVTVSFSIPAYNLTRSAVAGYDEGIIPLIAK